jgi:succinylglutamate desuccinylase
MRRIIGSYTQGLPGPLMICTAGLHGNEWAGIKALDLLLKMLEVEPITNPDFNFYGKIVAISGNIPALKMKKRYVNYDLNRLWTRSNFDHPGNEVEFGELIKLKKVIDNLVYEWGGESIYLLDLHTTTAEGGIFSLPTEDRDSIEIAQTFHAPVIVGLVERLKGTLVKHYTQREDVSITGLVFESGQHDDRLSVNRSIAAIINCMRTIGNVNKDDIENRHDQLLIDYSQGLPEVAEFLYGHHISEGDAFVMKPGYKNFDVINQGEELARDRYGPIVAEVDGLILMPHYQTLGDDGFFIIKEIKEKIK